MCVWEGEGGCKYVGGGGGGELNTSLFFSSAAFMSGTLRVEKLHKQSMQSTCYKSDNLH